MKYAGFWRRFGSFWVDTIIVLPITFLTIWGGEQSRLFGLYFLIPSLLFGLWFHAYLVKRYGGTPGKLLLKIEIVKLDGSPVGYREAFIRHSVLFILSILGSVAMLSVTMSMTDQLYYSMDYVQRSQYILAKLPDWYAVVNILMNLWIWSEFIVMLTNKKRRAIHDFIAGTVVACKQGSSSASADQDFIEPYVSA